MKKSLFILAFAITSFGLVANGQIQRGNVLVGGDIANLNLGLNKGSVFSVNINPKAAWFIKDNTAVGAYLTLGLETSKGNGTDFIYGIGTLVRQYAGGDAVAAVRHSRFFVEGNVGIDGINHSASSTNSTTNGLGLGIGPGLAYFITPNIGLEALLKYQGIFGFGTRVNTSTLNLNIGFQIYLPGRAVRRAATNTQ
ncbi:MAG: hypothetical protein JWR18_4150 [Segetibacter sp.]|jgi:hypothetical protein|nr:hypothetical protein [Segetibacter sp.]